MPNQQEKINKSDFIEWKRHPITRAYLQTLKQEVEDLKEQMASGATVDKENANVTQARTVEAVAKIYQLRSILSVNEVDIDEFEEL